MAIVDPNQIEKLKQEQATIQEVPGGFKGPHLPHVYDNRSECWRENILEAERKRLAAEGRDINGQTKDQIADFQRRRKVQLETKRKAELAAEMASQNK